MRVWLRVPRGEVDKYLDYAVEHGIGEIEERDDLPLGASLIVRENDDMRPAYPITEQECKKDWKPYREQLLQVQPLPLLQ